MSLERTKAREILFRPAIWLASYARNAKINICSDDQLGAWFIMQSSNSTCLHSHGSVDMAPLLARTTSDSFARFYTCGMRCDKWFCFAVQNNHLKFNNVVLMPKRRLPITVLCLLPWSKCQNAKSKNAEYAKILNATFLVEVHINLLT